MQFNPDPNKNANGVVFSRKSNASNLTYLPVKLNNVSITKCSHQKHLGIVLDSKSTLILVLLKKLRNVTN